MEGLEYSRTFEHVKVYNKLICRIKEERHTKREPNKSPTRNTPTRETPTKEEVTLQLDNHS